jgi:hypothetical protein
LYKQRAQAAWASLPSDKGTTLVSPPAPALPQVLQQYQKVTDQPKERAKSPQGQLLVKVKGMLYRSLLFLTTALTLK